MTEQQFPPQGYVPTLSAVDGISVFMPAPKIEDLDTRVDFACPNCRGVQAFNVSNGGLSCTACGYYQAPKGERVGRLAAVNEFRTAESERQKEDRIQRSLGLAPVVAAAQSAPSTSQDDYDWGEARQELRCSNCGASMLLESRALTHDCPFCGSSSVEQSLFKQDKLRPRYLIPFAIEAENATKSIKEWLGSSWMTPSDLQKRAGLDVLVGMFLPYWTFSATCSSNWKAEVGHDRTEWYSDSEGNRRTRTVTDWRWESGFVNLPINDLLVTGTSKLKQRLLDEVDDHFSITGLVDYEASYLAGFNAHTFDVPRDIAWEQGRNLMREMTKRACYSQASTSKVRNFSMSLDYAEETWRYILLPVYLTTYRYNEESFSVLLNGQSGLISGQRPVDWRKIMMVVVALFIPGIIGAIYTLLTTSSVEDNPALIITAILLIAALIFAVTLVISAINIRKKA